MVFKPTTLPLPTENNWRTHHNCVHSYFTFLVLHIPFPLQSYATHSGITIINACMISITGTFYNQADTTFNIINNYTILTAYTENKCQLIPTVTLCNSHYKWKICLSITGLFIDPVLFQAIFSCPAQNQREQNIYINNIISLNLLEFGKYVTWYPAAYQLSKLKFYWVFTVSPGKFLDCIFKICHGSFRHHSQLPNSISCLSR